MDLRTSKTISINLGISKTLGVNLGTFNILSVNLGTSMALAVNLGKSNKLGLNLGTSKAFGVNMEISKTLCINLETSESLSVNLEAGKKYFQLGRRSPKIGPDFRLTISGNILESTENVNEKIRTNETEKVNPFTFRNGSLWWSNEALFALSGNQLRRCTLWAQLIFIFLTIILKTCQNG